MCGIAGLLGAGEVEQGWLQGMLRIAGHRGPDDSGMKLFDREGGTSGAWRVLEDHATTAVGGLGHLRLSILDTTAAGHQPMASADGALHIVYNGEVYNYRELRVELKAAGHEFATGTDTEVLLGAWKEWGVACLDKLNGMFAFLLVDLKRGEFWAVRDRFGIKPLFFWKGPDGLLAFASEIKQFASLPGWHAVMNGQRVYDFLNWGITDHTEETCFAGVRQLPPGGRVCLPLDNREREAVSRNSIPVNRWYTLQARPWEGSKEEANREFQGLLADSVKLRLRSDVPVGSCLSGGLDSTAVACFVREFLDAPSRDLQEVFSVVAEVPRVDESRWIRAAAEHLGISGHEVCPGPAKVFEELPELVWHQDEPFGSTSVLAQWEVFRLASASGVKVMLDGQGADELLAGYQGSFIPARLAELFRCGRWLRMMTEAWQFREGTGISRRRLAMQVLDLLLPRSWAMAARRRTGHASPRPDWLAVEKWGVEPGDPLRALGGRGRSVNELSHSQLTSSSLQMLLRFEDRNSMAHSVEARVPFLDYRLVERVLGMPGEYKIARGWTKRLLRDGLKGILPEPIRQRRDKLGFATPEQEWATGSLKQDFLRHAKDTVVMMNGILRPRLMEQIESMLDKRLAFGPLPWRVVCLGAWIQRHNVALN